MNIAVAAATYTRMKVDRGDWHGDTISRTIDNLWHFTGWLPKLTAVDVRRVKRQHIQGWIDSNPRHSNAYRRVRLVAVRGLFRWLHQEGHIGSNPAIGVTSGAIPESLPRSFNDEEVEQLFEVARRDLRDLVCVSLCWNEGLRRIEVARMLLEDIQWRTQTAHVRGKFYRGNISRTVAVTDETMSAIDKYLAGEPPPNGRIGPLVRSRRISRGYEALTSHGIGQIIAPIIKDAGLKQFPWDGRSSHAGRHTAATQSLEAGARPEHMRRQFGWTSDVMLNRYTKGAALDLHEIHRLRAERKVLLGVGDGAA